MVELGSGNEEYSGRDWNVSVIIQNNRLKWKSKELLSRRTNSASTFLFEQYPHQSMQWCRDPVVWILVPDPKTDLKISSVPAAVEFKGQWLMGMSRFTPAASFVWNRGAQPEKWGQCDDFNLSAEGSFSGCGGIKMISYFIHDLIKHFSDLCSQLWIWCVCNI